MLDVVTVPVRVKDDVAGSEIVGDRVADAAEIHRPYTADFTIRGLVRMTGEDELGARIVHLASEFVSLSVRCDAIAVVAAR